MGAVDTLCLGSGFAGNRNDRSTKATQPMKSYEFKSTGGGSAQRRPCRRVRGPVQGPALRRGSVAVALFAAAIIAATAQTRVDLRTQSRNVDFSAASSTKPSKTGTTLPTTCSVGETFLKTDAAAGNNLYACTQANTWTVQGVPDPTGNADKVLSSDGAATGWRTMGGDVSGRPDALTVVRVQGRPVSSAAPLNGQAMVWNSVASQWQPQNSGAAAITSIFGRTGVVTAQTGDYTFGQIGGSVTDLQVSTGINANKIGSGTVGNAALGYLAAVTSDVQTQLNGKAPGVHSHTAAGDVTGDLGSTLVTALRNRTVAATAPVNGQALVWNAGVSQWQPQNVSGTAVGGAYSSSFTSQTTVIVPGSAHQLGTANVLVGCYDPSTPAMRIQPNTVSVHPGTFDVTVTFVVAQSGRCVVSSGGGSSGSGGGASMGAQLGDFNVTSASATVLTIGPNCSTATPCNMRWGNRVYTFVSAATVTLTAGTGVAYIYVDANGALTVGHNLTLGCSSSCTAAPGTAAFPVNSIPMYTWTATGGIWDTTGGLDKRAWLSGKILSAGTGIVTVDTGSNTNISVDAAAVPTYLTASAALNFGAIAAGACAADLTFPLPGAAAGNPVAPGWPGGLEAGLIGNMRVSAANTIAVRLCNLSGGAVSPASATYTGTIVRSF
jgi:hypothetical protein